MLELNDVVKKKIDFFVNPSLIYKLQQDEKKVTNGLKRKKTEKGFRKASL